MFHPLCVALGNLPWHLAKQKGWYTPIALLPVFPSTMPAEEKRARMARVLKAVLRVLKVAGGSRARTLPCCVPVMDFCLNLIVALAERRALRHRVRHM